MVWPFSRKRREFDASPRPIDLMIQAMKQATGTTASRTEALSVPAMRRGRNLICSVSTLPLEQVGPDNVVETSPLLEQIDPDVPNTVTIAQTVEDMLFDGVSWWLVTETDPAGFPVAARHLDVSSVSVNPPAGQNPAPLPSGIDPRNGVVWVDGQPVSGSRVIRFDSSNPAVLMHAGREIRRAVLLDQAAAMYADDPRPADYFEPADGADEISDDAVKTLLSDWKTARKQRATAYVPASLKYNSVDSPSPQQLQLVELAKQASLDIANALGVDPEDLGISTTSRTYSNDVDRRRNKVNEVLGPYMRAIEHRLSMGDVTRRGYRVRFNVTEFLLPDPTSRWNNYRTAKDMGAMTIEEIRQAEGLPPMATSVGSPEPEPKIVVPDDVSSLVDASSPASHTFDGADLTFADLPLETFSVDADNRIIEGLALPYNQIAEKNGIRFKFQKGALQWADVPRVKLLRDHDYTQPLGKAIQLKDTPQGFLARFKVARGPEGDRALELAEDGVLDGLSVGVDFDARRDATPDRRDRSVLVVHRADLREVSLTPMPSFDNARVTAVAASRTEKEGTTVPDTDTPEAAAPAPDSQPEPVTFTAEQVQAMLAGYGPSAAPEPDEPERPEPVNPARALNLSVAHEAVPYRFDRAGNFIATEHVFSADLHDMALSGDLYGNGTDAGKRVMGLLKATFDVQTGDVNELNPDIQRPDMYVDQRDYRTPLWDFVNKGAPPNGVQPFAFPKFASASGLVGDHTQATEPTTGTFVTTSQTVTPTAISGKATITREVWDMGGNPAVSTLIFNQMVRGWREGLESATATFLNTLTAATDIALTAGAVDDDLAAEWDAALADLQFIRGYDFEAFALEKELYKRFVAAVDADGRKLYSQINPTNANGTAASRFVTLNLGGVTGVPSWALASTAGSSNNSWLFDPSTVHGWATPPQRLEFPGSGASNIYTPVATVDLAIWGYKALANSDIGGVRQVTYDTTS